VAVQTETASINFIDRMNICPKWHLTKLMLQYRRRNGLYEISHRYSHTYSSRIRQRIQVHGLRITSLEEKNHPESSLFQIR
jgi:hypothetical protein